MQAKFADLLVVKDHEILLVQQRKPSAYGLWSYPGGRIEPGETSLQTVIREISEEIGTSIIEPVFFKQYKHVSPPNGELALDSFIGALGGPITLQHDELLAYGWFSLESLKFMEKQLRSPLVMQQATDAFQQAAVSAAGSQN